MNICGTVNNSYIPKSMCSLLWFKLLTRSEHFSAYFCHLEWKDCYTVRSELCMSWASKCWKRGFRNLST